MRLPQSWAQSFAPFTASAHEFAEGMTMSGSKLEFYYSEADKMKNVVLGRINSLTPHTGSDHLWICKVDVGREVLQIVTGAQNLKEGDICPVALHGALLPNGAEIRKGKLRGEQSDGMLCSLSELGLTIHDYQSAIEDGILVLNNIIDTQKYPIGSDVAPALGMDEIIYEFEITPNRPDCLSVRGLAREAAATFGVPFAENIPPAPTGEGDINSLLRVNIDAKDTCLRYCAAVVDNVRIAESPEWMRRRLRHAGVRPINNIVDITNYVMLEYGQPMHAFDYAYVNGGTITVRKANKGESIVTLDDVERKLDESMMVIADEKGPVAVAGIMGGEYSGVYDTTKKIVFESAAFYNPSVRATSRKLNLRTESSTRFEKGLDPNIALPALHCALQLVKELNAGDIVGGVIDEYPTPRNAYSIPFEPSAINALLGVTVPEDDMISILTPLGFTVQGGQVHVPTLRSDVTRTCDVAEEVARFVGYNKIPSTIVSGAAKATVSSRKRFERQMENVLLGSGLSQCNTYSFYGPKDLAMLNLPSGSPLFNALKILHPLGEDTSLMRTTALPSILTVIARNWAARSESCAVFEQATEYIKRGEDELPDEPKKYIMAAYGEFWNYLALKGIVEALLRSAGITNWYVKRGENKHTYHPGRCADFYITNTAGEEIFLGTIGEIHPLVCQNYDVKARIVAADISLDVLYAKRGETPQAKALPRFPALTRDLALVMQSETPASSVADTIQAAAGKRLESLKLFDIYTGEKLGEDKKSLAYSLALRDTEGTLTDNDADAIIQKVLKALEKQGIVLRS